MGVNEEKIKNNADLLLSLEKYKSGDEIEVVVLRGEETKKIKLVLDPSK